MLPEMRFANTAIGLSPPCLRSIQISPRSRSAAVTIPFEDSADGGTLSGAHGPGAEQRAVVMAFRIDPTRPVGDEIARVARDEIGRGIAAATSRRLPLKERIHEARSCCKKVRAIFKLARSSDPHWYRRENRRLGHAARLLSAIRDNQVILSTLGTLRRASKGTLSDSQYRRLSEALRAEREIKIVPAALTRTINTFTRQLSVTAGNLDRWQTSDAVDQLWTDFRHCYARCRRALRAVKHEHHAAAFHAWRKSAKTHYYQCRATREAWSPGTRPIIKELERLGEDLGHEHDLSVLRRRLQKLFQDKPGAQDRASLSSGLRALAVRRKRLRAKILARGKRVFAEKPKAHAARFRRWWKLAATE